MYMLKDHISYGNSKLPRHTAIFNMSSAKDCPSRKLDMCQLRNMNRCYARKAELQYPVVLPYRRRQARIWKRLNAYQFTMQFLEAVRRKRTRVKFLRVSESGDFESQADVNKLDHIAGLLEQQGVVTYCYSARKDLKFKQCDALVVNGSGFMAHNEFKLIEDPLFDKHKGKMCSCDCTMCGLCTMKHGETVGVKLH